jgi:hypothetical protein
VPCLMGCGGSSRNARGVEGDATMSDEEEEDVLVDDSPSMVSDGVGEAGAGAARRPRPLLQSRPGHHGIPRQQGVHLGEHVAAPDQSLWFACSHLASGEKEGDELRRNSRFAGRTANQVHFMYDSFLILRLEKGLDLKKM